jgi:hypothetical protein
MKCHMCHKVFDMICNCGSSNIIRDIHSEGKVYCTDCHTRYLKNSLLCPKCIGGKNNELRY